MARRKSKRKIPKPKKAVGKLDEQFDCPFCNHSKSCEVKMIRERKYGQIRCSICNEEYKSPIHHLSEPLDVFNDWVDACESVN